MEARAYIGSAVTDPEGEVGFVRGRTHRGSIVVEYDDGDELSWRGDQLRAATPAVVAATRRKKRRIRAVSGKIEPGIRDRMPKHLGGPGIYEGRKAQEEAKKKESSKKKSSADAKRKAEAEARRKAREAERARKERERAAKKKAREEERARRETQRVRERGRRIRDQERRKVEDPEFEQQVKRDASGQFSKTETSRSFTVEGGRVNRGDWVQTSDGSRRGRVMGRTKDGRVVIVSDDGKQTSHDRFALTSEDRRDDGFDVKGETWADAVERKKASREFLYAVEYEFETADKEGRNPVFNLGSRLDDTVKRLRAQGVVIQADAEGRYYMNWQGRKIRLKGYRRYEDDV